MKKHAFAMIAALLAVACAGPVRNAGERDGAEIVQLYVAPPVDWVALPGPPEDPLARPARELKGFEKVFLKAGESRDVTFTVTARDLSRFDADAHEWVADSGTYRLLVGASSADIRAEAPLVVK